MAVRVLFLSRFESALADPARAEGGDGERMARFREMRDQVEARVRSWLETHRRELRPDPPAPRRKDRTMARPELVGSARKAVR